MKPPGNLGRRDLMVDIWQLGFVLYGARTIERRFSVHEVFSQESAFVPARDGVNSTAGLQCAGGSSASFFSFALAKENPLKMMFEILCLKILPAKIT